MVRQSNLEAVRRNEQVDWEVDEEAHRKYIYHNYYRITREDRILTAMAICTMRQLPAIVERPLFGKTEAAVQVGVGGVLLGGAIMAPYMANPESGAYIDMGDVGKAQLNTTIEAIEAAKRGDNGIWQPHQDMMTECDSRWDGAFKKAARLGKVARCSVFDLPRHRYRMGSMQYVAESITEDDEEFDEAVDSFVGSIEPGGIVHVNFVEESEGWDDDGDKPAYSITPDQAGDSLSRSGVEVILNASTPASNMARVAGDVHGYKGMIVSVGVVKDTKSTAYIL